MRKELIKRYIFDIAVYTLDALDNLTHITNIEKWHEYITSQLVAQLSKLKKISCNKKMVATYENKINELLK